MLHRPSNIASISSAPFSPSLDWVWPSSEYCVRASGVGPSERRRSDALWTIAGGVADPGWTAHPFWIVHLGESTGARGQGTPRSPFDVQESTTRWWTDDVPLPVLYSGRYLLHYPIVPLGCA